MRKEKEVLMEILIEYKNTPLLWDPNNKLYSNKRAREQAYKILLDKMLLYDKNATLPALKKKIENLKTNAKIEYRKVLAARKRKEEYHPTLWYYDVLKFSFEVRRKEYADASIDDSNEQPDLTKETCSNEWEFEMLQNDDEEDSPSESKKRKLGSFIKVDFDGDSWKADDIEHQYLKIKEDECHEQDNLSFKEESTINKENNLNNKEACAFGRTVGLQLRQLSKKQRIFAEKLISDVIFHGRLNQLNMESSLHITNIA